MRALLPHEHSLWAWVLGPLALALAVAPQLGTALAVCAATAGFGAWNAGNLVMQGKRNSALRPALLAGVIAAALTLGAALTVPNRPLLVQVFLAAAVASYLVSRGTGGRLPRDPRFEWTGIIGLAWLGAGIAVAGGGSARVAVVAELVLATWFTLSLWFVKACLASILKRREPWENAEYYAGGLTLAVGVLAVASGMPWFMLVLPAYLLRAWMQPTLDHPSQVAAMGLAEARWALVAVIALSAIAQFA